MAKFLDMFSPIQKGNFGLTDEAIYKSIQYGGEFIPVFGGTQEHEIDRFVSEFGKTIYDESITIFDGEGIIISLDGSSGSMTYRTSGRFALNHHAGFFKLSQSATIPIILKFFSLFFEKQLQEISISEGSKTLTLNQVYSTDFDIPPMSVQQKIMDTISPLLLIKGTSKELISKIDTLLEKSLILKANSADEILLSDILEYVSRNDGLSEEGIYKRSSEINKTKKKIKVISGSIDGFYGYYPIEKGIHIVNNRPCLQVVTRGKACLMRFLEKGFYATNTNSMLIVIKEEAKAKLGINSELDEETYLKFLEFYLYPYLKEFSSSADLSVFPLTEAINEIVIPIIRLDGEIISISQKYQSLKDYKTGLNSSLSKIEDVFTKAIYVGKDF
jgi:hypothetical protein